MNKNEIPSPADRLDALALESGVGERAAGDRAAGDRAAAGREQLVNKRVKLESSTECASDVGAPSAIPLATRLSVLDKGVARKQPSHIVGIGVSMAGLDLLQKLFGSLSSDMGAAYVVVQHGTPDCQRIQVEVLSTYTAMPVQAVEMGIEISANSVYLIRPSQNVRLVAGRWYLNDIASGCSLYPIDQFFRTLADEKTHQAIGVILSGVGDDGVRGAHALKEADGMVIVQASRGDARGLVLDRAMASGLVDLCLPVEDIGSALEKFIKHPLIRQGDGGLRIAIDDQRDSMVQIFDLLRKKKKIDFSYYKHTTIARRIERRMGIKQLHSLNDYVHCLRESSDELSILMNELLMGSTRFFRDDEAFRCVQKRAIRALIKAASVETGVRIWVAGCSTGEEAYSFAIIADEECRRLGKRVPITIYATDVDADALTVAAAATFTAHIRQDVSAERLASYFTWKDKRYVLSAAIRRMVIFVMHNMITDPSFLSIDLISCRNTLIYFQHSMQKRVLASMHAALKWEGLLFLGVSESVGDFHSYFDVLDARSRLYRKSSRCHIPLTTPPPLVASKKKVLHQSLPPIDTLPQLIQGQDWRTTLARVCNRLVDCYAPPCLVLNAYFQVQHSFGDLRSFLHTCPSEKTSGKASMHIQDLVVDDLLIPVSTALHKAAEAKKDVLYTNVCVRHAHEEIHINLRVIGVVDGDPRRTPMMFVVAFENPKTCRQAELTNTLRFDGQLLDRQEER